MRVRLLGPVDVVVDGEARLVSVLRPVAAQLLPGLRQPSPTTVTPI